MLCALLYGKKRNKEMELFRKFREFSKSHPEVTYEEFIKSQLG
jgi:hypothetical protein